MAIDADLAADGEGVGASAFEEGADIVVVIDLPAIVAVDECWPVLIIDDQVEIAVVVESP